MKERVTLTLDKDIVRMVDERVDGSHIKNRSHAIELYVRQALRGSMPTTAVILVGGKGADLKPLTDKMPKALIEINGHPIVEYNIDLCKRNGIKNIILAVGHMADQIMKHYGDGSKFGVNISYVQEDEPLGTAGALRLLRDKLNETFILMNGDELKDINLHRMYHMHVENEAKATIALTTVEDTSIYGVALLDGSKILRFVEKPKKEDAPSKLINAGVYIIEPDVIKYIPEGYAMMEQDVFPKLAREGQLFGYPMSGQWFDIRNMEFLRRAAKEWKGFVR